MTSISNPVRNQKAFREYTLSDWMNYSPILLLPSEVRTPLWSYLPPKDRKSIREVCKIFKHEIDTCAGLAIDLDERFFSERNISSTLPPSAFKLIIWGADETNDYVSRLLYNARLVRNVTFSGPTDISHFKKVMARCPHLASITVTDHAQFDTRFLIPFKLREVKALHLGAHEKTKSAGQPPPPLPLPPTPWYMYADLLANVQFPCLRVLRIEYTLQTEEDYCATFRAILKYLVAHKTVVELTIRLHKADDASVVAKKATLLQLLTPYEEGQLKCLNLKKLVASTEPEVGKIWEIILLAQKNLELLDFLNHSMDWFFFSKIVKKNRNSVRVLRLRRLLANAPLEKPQARVDLGAFEFESCPKLKELFISRFANSGTEVCLKKCGGGGFAPFLDRVSSKFPELIRFKALPKWLEKLHVQGFTVRTEDLLTIPGRLDSLKVLELQLLGYHPGNGGEVLVLEQGGGGDTATGNGDHKKIMPMPKDISLDGFGVTPSVLKGLVCKLRKLDTLFVEEFYNDHTALGKEEPGLVKAVAKVNLIPGECRLKQFGYYGLLVARKDPISRDGGGGDSVDSDLEERGDLWDVRFNQYRTQYRTLMLNRKNNNNSRGGGEGGVNLQRK